MVGDDQPRKEKTFSYFAGIRTRTFSMKFQTLNHYSKAALGRFSFLGPSFFTQQYTIAEY